jgi:hypothetical protein
MQQRVLRPLGMEHSAVTFTPWMKDHLALGHDPQGAVTANWDVGVLVGAGGIRSDAVDMLEFLAANVDTQKGPLGPAMALAHRERAPSLPNAGIGLNWISLHAGSDTIVWHDGGTGGYSTFAGFIPSRRIAVVVLSNTGGASVDDLGLHLLSPAIPLAPPPAPTQQFTAIPLSPAALQTYVGTYELAPTFRIEVTFQDGVLWGQPTAQPKFRLWPYTDHDFFLKEVAAQISFERDAAGAVAALVLHQNGRDQRAKKLP